MKKFIFLLLLITPYYIYAGGIQASPSKVTINTTINNKKEQIVTIANPTAETQVFSASIENDISYLSVYPKTFTIEAGSNKKLLISVNSNKETTTSNTLIVTAKSISDTTLTTQTGVKIPVEIIVTNSPDSIWTVLKKYYLELLLLTTIMLIAVIAKQLIKPQTTTEKQ